MGSVYMKIVLVLILMRLCIDAKQPGDPPDIRRKMIKLLTSCFADHLNPVITTPDLYEIFREAPWKVGIPPMILIDKYLKVNNDQQHYSRFASYVFAPYSVKSFNTMIQKAKASPWWDNHSMFFIIGNFKSGCKSASKILKHSWNVKLLSALFLCHEEGQGTMLYTYNPYRNQAPHPWKEVEDSNKPNDNWTLYTQKYRRGRKNCESLMFNKVTFRMKQNVETSESSQDESNWFANSKTFLNDRKAKISPAVFKNIIQRLLSVVNITAILNNYSGCSDNKDDKSYNVLQLVHDLFLNLIGICPFNYTSSELSLKSGNRRIVLLTLVGLVLVFYKKLRSRLNSSDNSPVSLNGNPPSPSYGNVMEYLFYGIIHLVLILSIAFESNISLFLTQSQHNYVNDLNNLKTQQCDAYEQSIYQNNLHEVRESKDNSKKSVDHSEMCERILWKMVKSSSEQQPITSKSNIDKISSHWCSKIGPLRKQIDLIVPQLNKADLEEYLDDSNSNFQMRESSKGSSRNYYNKLEDLSFAFTVLIIGIGTSFIIFMIETCSQIVMKMKTFVSKIIDHVKDKFVRLI